MVNGGGEGRAGKQAGSKAVAHLMDLMHLLDLLLLPRTIAAWKRTKTKHAERASEMGTPGDVSTCASIALRSLPRHEAKACPPASTMNVLTSKRFELTVEKNGRSTVARSMRWHLRVPIITW
jgi:hypothetical protein